VWPTILTINNVVTRKYKHYLLCVMTCIENLPLSKECFIKARWATLHALVGA
jgi:hypothetical protein